MNIFVNSILVSSEEIVLHTEKECRGVKYNIHKYSNSHVYNFVDPRVIVDEPGFTIISTELSNVCAYLPPLNSVSDKGLDQNIINALEGIHISPEVEITNALEGTFVAFFWAEQWEVCTRNGVGCEYAFGSVNKTFREMVLDAFGGELSCEELSKDCCYTCVLQHPENHIVYPVSHLPATLTLINVYQITNSGEVVNIVTIPEHDERWKSAKTVFRQSEQQVSHSMNHITINTIFREQTGPQKVLHADLLDTSSVFYPPAWIFTNKTTGNTILIRNHYYEAAKRFRNMQPNLKYLYLELKKNALIELYLDAFPKYKNQFDLFAEEYNSFVKSIYEVYVKYYILKIRNVEYPKKYFVHSAKIHHNVYLAYMNRIKVTEDTVRSYLYTLTTSGLFHALNA
jgi:hypothetical protein